MTCTKRAYNTQAAAQAKLEDIIANYKETGSGGKSWRRLNVYRCKACSLWHIGRANSYHAAPKTPKGPTPGDLRRAARKAAAKAAKATMYADYTDTLRICKILADRQIALYEALGIKPRTPNSAQ
jgi:hypothetical protein